jgi:hypothetical protein
MRIRNEAEDTQTNIKWPKADLPLFRIIIF